MQPWRTYAAAAADVRSHGGRTQPRRTYAATADELGRGGCRLCGGGTNAHAGNHARGQQQPRCDLHQAAPDLGRAPERRCSTLWCARWLHSSSVKHPAVSCSHSSRVSHLAKRARREKHPDAITGSGAAAAPDRAVAPPHQPQPEPATPPVLSWPCKEPLWLSAPHASCARTAPRVRGGHLILHEAHAIVAKPCTRVKRRRVPTGRPCRLRTPKRAHHDVAAVLGPNGATIARTIRLAHGAADRWRPLGPRRARNAVQAACAHSAAGAGGAASCPISFQAAADVFCFLVVFFVNDSDSLSRLLPADDGAVETSWHRGRGGCRRSGARRAAAAMPRARAGAD